MINQCISVIKNLYKTVFNEPSPRLKGSEIFISAPGRINLIGEHTDYNQGHVLPGAINRKTYCGGILSKDEYIYLYSLNKNEIVKFKISELGKKNKKIKWYDYAKGVISEYLKRGFEVKPFILGICSDVPIGMGVSSSASFEVAVAKFIKKTSNISISDKKLAQITKSAENNYVGVKCGIMDQLTSIMGKKNHLIHIDCKDTSTEYVNFPSKEISIILIDSLEKHSLANSGYNERLKECNVLLNKIKEIYPEINSFRDLNLDVLSELKNKIPQNIINRGKHFVEENIRVIETIKAIGINDFDTIKALMFLSHESLSNYYEVSTESLDRLIELAKRQENICYGARLMGAGFGGVTINLVKTGDEKHFIEKVADKYYSELGHNKQKNIIICKIDDGAKIEHR